MSTFAEPLAYQSGKVLFNPQFQTAAQMRAVLPLIEGVKARVQDLGIYLFLVYSPLSLYQNWSLDDREAIVVKERISEVAWLKKVLPYPDVQELIALYRSLVCTPSQKLQQGLLTALDRYLKELAELKGSDDQADILAKVKRGTELYDAFEKVKRLGEAEEQAKIKGGYKPRKFEFPPELAR